RGFRDKRGLAPVLAAAGYGFGAILTNYPIYNLLKTSTHQHTLVIFCIIFAVIGILAALPMRSPTASDNLPAPLVVTSKRNYEPMEMIKTPVFWLMFFMFSLMATSGLVVVANFAPFAREFGVADMIVLGTAALPLA